jgi:hypothetical protein
MTNQEAIKDFHGRTIGYIETKPNGDKVVRDFYKRILGTYNKSSNTTRDFYGRIIARGDNTGILFSDAYKRKNP